MKTFVLRWTFVLFFISMGIFEAVLHAESPEVIRLSVKDTYPGDTHDGFAQPGERISVSLSVILDFIPSEAYIICDSEHAGVESPITRFISHNGDTIVNSTLEPILYIREQCPTDFTIPFSLIYRKDTTYDTLDLGIHTVGVLDSCFLDEKVNRPGKKIAIHALCSSAEDYASGFSSVIAVVKKRQDEAGDSVILFDDGKHLDGESGDGHFANNWWTLSNAYDYNIDIVLKDSIMDWSHAIEQSTGFTTKWFSQTHPRVIIADPYDNSPDNEVFAEISTLMDSLDLDYDSWNIWYRGFPDSNEMSQWGIRKSALIWATKLGGTLKHSTKGKALVQHFLEKGGNIFLATPYLGSYISHYGEKDDSLFLEQMLLAKFSSLLTSQDSTRVLSLHNPFTGQIMDTIKVSLSLSDSNEFVSFIDVLNAIPPATSIVKGWQSGEDVLDTTSSFGLQIENGGYRAIYLSFDLDEIEPFSLRKDFFGACLEWIATEAADSFSYDPLIEEEIEVVTLSDPYPNPFLHESTIPFALLNSGVVNLVICDLTGRTVKRLIHSSLNEGNYYAVWDGKDEKGEETAVGYYFVRLSISTVDRKTGEDISLVVSKKLLKLRK